MKTNGLVFWILGLISLILSLGCLSADSGEGYVFIIAILGSQLSIIIIALGFIIANQEKKRDISFCALRGRRAAKHRDSV